MFDQTLIERFTKAAQRVDIDSTNFDWLLKDSPFASWEITKQTDHEKVVTLQYKNPDDPAILPEEKYVDLFVLKEGSELQAHYHEHAAASIIILKGEGSARIGDERIEFSERDEFIFPKGIVHSVRAAEGKPAVFLSLQNSPIVQPGGSFDYIPA